MFTSVLIPGARSSSTLKVLQDSQTFKLASETFYAGPGRGSALECFVLFCQQNGLVVTWAVLTQRIFERLFLAGSAPHMQ